MSLGADLDTELLQNLTFKITDTVYLGVVLPKNPKLIFRLNFLHKLEDLKIDISKWRTLSLSMIGCINAGVKRSLCLDFYIFFQNIRFGNSPFYLGL